MEKYRRGVMVGSKSTWLEGILNSNHGTKKPSTMNDVLARDWAVRLAR
jgi:hypothetical protein